MKFIGQGLCKDVLAYPLHVASVYRFCSSVPEFIVSLSSVHASQQTTLRLTNRLHQLACKRLSLSGIFGILRYLAPMLGAHKMFMQLRGSVVARKFFIPNLNFATWTVKQFLNPQLHLAKRWASCFLDSVELR